MSVTVYQHEPIKLFTPPTLVDLWESGTLWEPLASVRTREAAGALCTTPGLQYAITGGSGCYFVYYEKGSVPVVQLTEAAAKAIDDLAWASRVRTRTIGRLSISWRTPRAK